MRLAVTALSFLLLAAAADAQTVPAGVGSIATKEKLKIGSGCSSFKGAGSIIFSIFPDGTWLAQATAGTFSGTLTPADPDGRSWNLQFDGSSLLLYTGYLEDAGTSLCGTDVTISGGFIQTFALKLSKDRTRISFQLKTSATGSTIFGYGSGKHLIKGKGSYALGN